MQRIIQFFPVEGKRQVKDEEIKRIYAVDADDGGRDDDTGKTPFEFDKYPGWNLNHPTIRVLESSVKTFSVLPVTLLESIRVRNKSAQ